MRWRQIVAKRAAKNLNRFPETDRERIRGALRKLTVNPLVRGVQQLRSGSTTYRMRIGSYRILFDVVDEYHLIVVQAFERRTSTTY